MKVMFDKVVDLYNGEKRTTKKSKCGVDLSELSDKYTITITNMIIHISHCDIDMRLGKLICIHYKLVRGLNPQWEDVMKYLITNYKDCKCI